ncbi:acyl-CoA dehydrogenase family protein [Zavarzinia sp.]|uniref:acyl-CoA dehydrogenase family protein n=1 Tax=Zavarzinia sp. TaxID=2027920 RepID=UPI003569CCD3
MTVAAKIVPAEIPTEAELLERARALTPVLRQRAARTEENRRVLDETIADFVAAGFYRILQPAAYGGYEMSPLTLFKVVIELAKGCPSSAWCLCLITVHNWEAALMDPRAAEDLWGKDPNTRFSSSYAPFGKVTKVEGGYRLSGRWMWSSGSDHCSWVILGGVVPGDGTEAMPDLRAFLVPRGDYRVEDVWHVLGLKGTGSNDIVVEDAFIPEHRSHQFAHSFFMADPGRATFTSRNYRYSFGTIFAYSLAIVTIGMAEGARACFTEDMKVRLAAYDGAKAMEDPFVRQRLAEADAIIRGLRARLEGNFAEMDALIDAGEDLPLDLRVRNKWDAQYIAKEAQRAIELLFKASGARGLKLDSPMQRFFRDVHAASNHAFLNADKGSLNAGMVALGGGTSDFAL